MQLAELQAKFFMSIKSDDTNNELINVINGSTGIAQNRIKLYQNSILNNIKKGLKAIFPVCIKVVGDDFFSAMAEVYINQHPPRLPDLNAYGNNFPDFIAQFPPAQSLPYLADVARLDFTWHQVFYGPDNARVDLNKLFQTIATKGEAIIFALPEGAKLIDSLYPIADIWEICQPEYTGSIEINFNDNANHLLIWQVQQTICIEKLTQDEFAFLKLIKDELPFIQICEILTEEQKIVSSINELLLSVCQRGFIQEKISPC